MQETGEERKRVFFLSVCHTFSDFYATVFVPLLYTFQTALGVSLGKISLLPALSAMFTSLIQPAFGLVGDRLNKRVVAGVGILCSALFVGMLGLTREFWVVAMLLVLSGLGVAAFHPSAGAEVTKGFRGNPASRMSVFLMGGSIGLAIAPVASTMVVARLGLGSLWMLALPGCVLGALMVVWRGKEEEVVTIREKEAWEEMREFVKGASRDFWIHWVSAVIRSFVIVSFNTYVSVIGVHKGWGEEACGRALSVFLLSSTGGLVVGGRLSRAFTARGLIFWSSLGAVPFYFLYTELGGVWAVVNFGAAGFVLALGTAVNIVEAQKTRPSSAGVISGAMMGFSWGIAGMFQPVVAVLAGVFDIEFGLEVAAVGSVVAGCVILLLRRGEG